MGSTPIASTILRGRNGFDGAARDATRRRAVDFPMVGRKRVWSFSAAVYTDLNSEKQQTPKENWQ